MFFNRPLIASKMESRTGKQCRERYLNHLSPDVKIDPWSPDEDSIINNLYDTLGSQWSKFVDHLPGIVISLIMLQSHALNCMVF